MLFAEHYAKLFQILLNNALHEKHMSFNTAVGQNKCLFCRNPYLGIHTPPCYRCKSRSITKLRREKEESKAHLKRKSVASSRVHNISVL